jgi:hypothetical protein
MEIRGLFLLILATMTATFSEGRDSPMADHDDDNQVVLVPQRSQLQKFAGSFHQDFAYEYSDFYDGARDYIGQLPVPEREALKIELRSFLSAHENDRPDQLRDEWLRLGAGYWPRDSNTAGRLRDFLEMM